MRCPEIEPSTGSLWELFLSGLPIGIAPSAVLRDLGLLRTRPDRNDER